MEYEEEFLEIKEKLFKLDKSLDLSILSGITEIREYFNYTLVGDLVEFTVIHEDELNYLLEKLDDWYDEHNVDINIYVYKPNGINWIKFRSEYHVTRYTKYIK